MSTPRTKLFVGHLPDGCTNADLFNLFSKHGTVTECYVINKYGFVHMSTSEEAQDALKALNNYYFRGSSLSVEPPKSKLHPEPGSEGRARGGSSRPEHTYNDHQFLGQRFQKSDDRSRNGDCRSPLRSTVVVKNSRNSQEREDMWTEKSDNTRYSGQRNNKFTDRRPHSSRMDFYSERNYRHHSRSDDVYSSGLKMDTQDNSARSVVKKNKTSVKSKKSFENDMLRYTNVKTLNEKPTKSKSDNQSNIAEIENSTHNKNFKENFSLIIACNANKETQIPFLESCIGEDVDQQSSSNVPEQLDMHMEEKESEDSARSLDDVENPDKEKPCSYFEVFYYCPLNICYKPHIPREPDNVIVLKQLMTSTNIAKYPNSDALVWDIYNHMKQYGSILEFKVLSNTIMHLIRNIMIEYNNEEEAKLALKCEPLKTWSLDVQVKRLARNSLQKGTCLRQPYCSKTENGCFRYHFGRLPPKIYVDIRKALSEDKKDELDEKRSIMRREKLQQKEKNMQASWQTSVQASIANRKKKN